MTIQLHDLAQHLMSLLTDVPPTAKRDLHDQAPHMQPLQHPAHRVTLPTALRVILGRPVQRLADLGVAKAVQQVLTGRGPPGTAAQPPGSPD